jgi:hypothetical protein
VAAKHEIHHANTDKNADNHTDADADESDDNRADHNVPGWFR